MKYLGLTVITLWVSGAVFANRYTELDRARWNDLALQELQCSKTQSFENLNPKQLNTLITAVYAKTYLHNPKLNNWYGLAALVSDTVGIAVSYSEFKLPIKRHLGFGWYEDRRTQLKEIATFGGLYNFLDMHWIHHALKETSLEELSTSGLIDVDQYKALKKMQSDSWSEVYSGVREWNQIQQERVLQPIYNENQPTANLMTLTLYSPTKGKWYFPRGLFWAVQPLSSFGNLEHRLLWGDQHVVAPWVWRSNNSPLKIQENMEHLIHKAKKLCSN